MLIKHWQYITNIMRQIQSNFEYVTTIQLVDLYLLHRKFKAYRSMNSN